MMASELRADQLDKIVAISAARKLRKQAALAEARATLVEAQSVCDRAQIESENAVTQLQAARISFAQQAASDQALLWRGHCENVRDKAVETLDEAKHEVANAEAEVQMAIEELLRHNFRHDRIVDHAKSVHRQIRNQKEARSDDEFTDSRSNSATSSRQGNA
jgi:sugar-specific transcriptional regulator TrmB